MARQQRESATTVWARQAHEQWSKMTKLDCTIPRREAPDMWKAFNLPDTVESLCDVLALEGVSTIGEWIEKHNLPKVFHYMGHGEPSRPAPKWVEGPMTCYFRPIRPDTLKSTGGDMFFVVFEPKHDMNERMYAWIMSHFRYHDWLVPSREAFERFLEPFQRSSGGGVVTLPSDNIEEALEGRLGFLHADAINTLGFSAAMDLAFATDIQITSKDEVADGAWRSTITDVKGVSEAGRAYVLLNPNWLGADADEWSDGANGMCIEWTEAE